MEIVTINLTPGRSFYNFQIKKAKKLLDSMNSNVKTTEYNAFIISKIDRYEKIKIRNDGALYYTVGMIDFNQETFYHLLDKIKNIINVLNPLYEGMLNLNKLYIYLNKDYKFERFKLLGYSIKTENILNL